ncbi:ATP-binding protein [Notoacmeibacter sp. MSK16QG-6]|uniref:ATP-binding protein n=1 Tax=Notoacmeibacter sp. MSK16QG-6 TaxID=2957982 RepID=UPI00209E2456|nr:ATP-binding protein [Notoacmeibacter sp. MSK16QG-6]MCP1200824.1 ATP-binding protein [Notoacmeibacter sp. MSK16QG-6]
MRIEEIEDVEQLRRINRVLMNRVESDTNHHGNSFSLFQTALNLEAQVRRRTDELSTTLGRLEKSNHELASAKEAAEEANRSKTRFLAAASHDLMQPLNASLLSLSLLEDEQTTEEGRRLVEQMHRSMTSIEELLRTLLEISKFDAGAVKPSLSDLSLDQLLRSLEETFQPFAELKKLKLTVRCQPLNIRSDKTMIRRILQNLISNALRYTTHGGVLVGVRDRSDGIVIDIYDTGCGIDPSDIDRIFEEFQRGRRLTYAEQGLGLGLSIVRRMVDALGYRLAVSSKPGKGTRFRLTLPLTAMGAIGSLPSTPSTRQIESTSIEGRTILLIENDPAVSKAMASLLRSWQLDVIAVSSLDETMRLVLDRKTVPDLIIADQNLDDGDLGTSAVAAIRALTKRRIPALIVSANASRELEYLADQMKMEMMQKPVKPAQLRALMSHMLAHQEEGPTA